MMKEEQSTKIKKAVKDYYRNLITHAGPQSCCCSPASTEIDAERSCCSPAAVDKILSAENFAETIGYKKTGIVDIPADAVENTFGCGAPLNYADIQEGQVVLDPGSGAGLDVFLASKKVGKTGKVIGLDMTPEMIKKAEENAQKMNVTNVEFQLGEMENMPIENNSVDWIISNCVINLSPDKAQVFREAYRVLKPGGQLVVSDIVADGLSDELRENMSAWAGCVSGALSERDYLQAIKNAGFSDVEVLDRTLADEDMFSEPGVTITGEIASIKVKAKKL